VQIIDSGDSGQLEKGSHRIRLKKWKRYDDHSLVLYSTDKKGMDDDKKNDNPIFISMEVPWTLTEETRVVLRKMRRPAEDKATTVPLDTECHASDISEEPNKSCFKIEVKDTRKWEFSPHKISLDVEAVSSKYDKTTPS